MKKGKFLVATATYKAETNMLTANLANMEDLIITAKKHEIDLILFPELNVTGYSTLKNIPVIMHDHWVVERLKQMAKEYNMIIAAGMPWQSEGDKPYLAHGLWKPDGSYELYFKTHLGKREEEAFLPGNHLPIFNVGNINIGFMLCLEHHFPDIAQTLVLRGADLILCPHATPRLTPIERQNSWNIALRARAYDNCTFIMASNMVGFMNNQVPYPGGLSIIGPKGNIINERYSGEEDLIIGEINLKEIKKSHTTPKGSCRRFYAPLRRKELYE